MAKTKPNPKVDGFFEKAEKWRKELKALREIALGGGLDEMLKWGCPCYSLEDRNIVLIHAFKDYCAFLFFKGALLKDPKKILIQQTKNVQAARQVRFASLKEITGLEATLKGYIQQAIEVEKAGLKVEFKKTEEFPMPVEFRRVLDKDRALKAAFQALTPGRQRAYLLHFAGAKQSSTRESRIEKCVPLILDGMGLND
jgi:uncharacterized protein YdeI (YjbR/CyaY-like superfamily)